jgi:hypothetical protein
MAWKGLTMSYEPKHFELYEVVPPILMSRPEAFLWHLFDDRILRAADLLRDRYGKMVANTWRWGGTAQFRGFRPADCKVGAEFSQHKFGRALDLVPVDCTAEEVRQDIQADDQRLRGLITRIEKQVHWLHIDCANYGIDGNIYFFNP